METLTKLLLKLRENLDLYLEGRKSFLLLRIFINGFKFSAYTDGKYNTEEWYSRFLYFVIKKYNTLCDKPYFEATDVYRVIEQNSASDEAAFDIFYELLDEFLSEEERQVDSVIKLIYKIRDNPALYFGGRESLALLRAFINGYLECQYETDENYQLTIALSGFQEYAQNRYQINANHSWDRIIDFYCSSDREALEVFYKLLDEFIGKTEEE